MSKKFCKTHNISWNPETVSVCPLCATSPKEIIRKRRKPTMIDEKHPNRCPFCGNATKFDESCSRIECLKRAGYTAVGKKKITIYACRVCDKPTRSSTGVCNNHACLKQFIKELLLCINGEHDFQVEDFSPDQADEKCVRCGKRKINK